MLKNKLKIVLITYNRIFFLERTLIQIFDKNSPIKDFDITVLDNCSTDGTEELVKSFCIIHDNLKYVKNPVNVGGNANIVKAFETAAASKKEYFWCICDDDKFDFSNWAEVEEKIAKGADIICLSDYSIRNETPTIPEMLFQLAFVPSGIFKTELLDSIVLTNMYNSIADSFPQLCPTIHAINLNSNIVVLRKPVVFNGLHCNKACKNSSMRRGTNLKEITQRHRYASWILGYSNVIKMLSDKNLQQKVMHYAVICDEIYGNWNEFYYQVYTKYFQNGLFNYIFEIFNPLPFSIKFKFYLKCLLWKVIGLQYFKKLKLYRFLKNNRHNHKKPENKEYWVKYLEKQNTQKYIDNLAKKFKGKKILLYGNGIISRVLQENYDLSKLNIVAITDKMFLGCDGIKEHKYKIVSPNKLKTVDFDAVIITIKRVAYIRQCLKDNGYKQKIIPLIKKEAYYVCRASADNYYYI